MAFKGPIYEWSTTASDNDDIDSTINYRERQQPSTLNDSARALMARVKAFVSLLGGTSGGGGTVNAYTITSPVGHEWAEYAKGQLAMLEVPGGATNTGASTLKIDSLSALPITFPDGAGVAAGDLVAGGSYLMRCTGTAWHIVGGQSEVSSFMRGMLDDPDAATARGTLGLGNLSTVTASAFALTLLDDADAATARTTLGLGNLSTFAASAFALTLLDDANAATARGTLGLGTAAVANTGTSGNVVPFLDGANTFSAAQTFSAFNNQFTGSSNNGPRFTNPYWAWMRADGTRNGYVQFQDGGVAQIVNEATNGGINLIPNGTGTLTRAGNLIYDAGNLPGTSLTWTAAQTFSAGAVTVTSVNGGGDSFRSARADSLWSFYNAAQSARLGFLRHDSTTMSFVNDVSGGAISFTTTGGGSFVVNGNVIYHAGNLPGTAINWTAAFQTFSGGNTRFTGATNNGPQFDDPFWAWMRASGTRNGFIQFQNSGLLSIVNEVTNGGINIVPNGTGLLQRAGNTIYDQSNLPGSAIAWTASQTFNTTLDISAGQILRFLNGANNRVYLDINATNFSVSRQNSSGTYIDSPINFALSTGALNFTVAPTVAGNTVYHAGNLPGTNVNWTAAQTFNAGVIATSTYPFIDWRDTDGPVGSRNWRIDTDGTQLYFSAYNDAFSVATPFLIVNRTGTTINTVNVANGTLQQSGVDVVTTSGSQTLTNKTINDGTSSAAVQASSETTGALTSASRNRVVRCTGNITLPSSGMSDGDVILIDPRGTARTVSRPGSHTMYVNNADVATATTGAHNIVVAMFHSSSKWTLQGSVT